MKAIAYNIKPFEKEFLAIANRKKHEITLISNTLSPETAVFAGGKTAVIISVYDQASAAVMEILANSGVKYLVTRSSGTDHIDKDAAARFGIKLSNVPSCPADHSTISNEALQETANQTIRNLDLWQQNKCVGKACVCAKGCRAMVLNETN